MPTVCLRMYSKAAGLLGVVHHGHLGTAGAWDLPPLSQALGQWLHLRTWEHTVVSETY
jgi:hypothetical protein